MRIRFVSKSIIISVTNIWLGDNFDSARLYGTLLEGYVFMKGEEDVIAAYKIQYDDAMIMLKRLSEGKNRQDTYQSEQVRVAVE